MDVSGLNSTKSTYSTTVTNDQKVQENATDSKSAENKVNDAAVVYEKSNAGNTDSSKTIYSKDSIVAKLKADQEARIASMQSLVTKLLGQQKDKFDIANMFGDNASNVKSIFEEAAKNADPETIAQAKADVAEDGYWGVEQTSDRLVDMAIALSGGDTSKADLMIDSIKKGFEQATKAWGDDLPDISQKTVDAAIEKLNQWKAGGLETL